MADQFVALIGEFYHGLHLLVEVEVVLFGIRANDIMHAATRVVLGFTFVFELGFANVVPTRVHQINVASQEHELLEHHTKRTAYGVVTTNVVTFTPVVLLAR